MEFSGGGSAAWGVFLQAAVSLNAKLVTVEIRRLEQADLEEAIAVAQGADDDEVESQRAVLIELEKCRARVGHISSFSLGFIVSDPVANFRFDWHSPWNQYVYATREALEGPDDGDQDMEKLD